MVFKLFNDIGMNGIIRQSGLQLSESAVGPLQQQYPNPDFPNTVIPRNLELVPGHQFPPPRFDRRGTGGSASRSSKRHSASTTRIIRCASLSTISAPRGAFALTDQTQRYLQSIGVLNTQVIPELNTLLTNDIQKFPTGLVETKSTFRFTINTTF